MTAARNVVPSRKMNQKELKELIEFLIEKDIAEFELERGDVKMRVKRGGDTAMHTSEVRYMAAPPNAPVSATHMTTPGPVAAPLAPANEAAAADEELF